MENVPLIGLCVSKHFRSKIELIESSLHQTIYNFKDFVTEFEQMHIMTDSIKKEMIAQKEKCESKCCIGSEKLKKVIESKENIMQLVGSALTKLNETKDFNILTQVFRILVANSEAQESVKVKTEKIMEEANSDNINIEAMTLKSPTEEPPENMSTEDTSVSEIDGTPTGRRSPIIQSKKLKTSTINAASRDKKKCPQSWLTPEKKSMKVTLSYTTPTRSRGTGRMRQQRITLIREKPSTIVDLTTIPQFSKGRNSQADDDYLNTIKQEVVENDDTIMPSPTSGPVFPLVYKSLSKESPQKFKKPLSLIRVKPEKTIPTNCKENQLDDSTEVPEPGASIDLLKDYPNNFVSPKKSKTLHTTTMPAEVSMSLLQPVNDMTKSIGQQCNSLIKHPLADNINALNVPCDIESSMSILRKDVKIKVDPFDENIKRTKCEILEPLYKEPTVRTKVEKKALPGWSCEQCNNFYGELYKDNPEMKAKKMDMCSKHRGRNNPERPKTPTGYWEPRWDVPEDTEEFNRRNNAV